MMRKIILSMLLITTVLFIYQYNNVNEDFPRKYFENKYDINDQVSLDNCIITLKDVNVVKLIGSGDIHNSEGNDSIEFKLKIHVKNNSESILDAASIIELSKLSIGGYYQDYCNPEGQINKINRINPNEEIELVLGYRIYKYDLKRINSKSTVKFYVSKELYKNEIQEYMDNNILYGKFIECGGSLDELSN